MQIRSCLRKARRTVSRTQPWISGGIEFNWPQHHRPTTFAPVDYRLQKNADGSVSVQCSEVDQMYGTKGEMVFTLYPDKAYLEIKGRLYNRTSLPQTFLWWANPAVAVNDHTQSIFPPDVTAVFDHGKRDVSKFPIATGVYYKYDYGRGVDISRYKNIPVPTSYMRNRIHCAYLIALGNYGLGNAGEAAKYYRQVLSADCSYQGAILHGQPDGSVRSQCRQGLQV